MDGTVLVADDDRTIRTVLTQALTRAGCKVHATASLVTLMRWVEEGKGDLVISDVIMPDGNGLEALPKISEERPGLPVIVISAQNTIMTAIQAAEAEAYDYLPKPYNPRELEARIKSILRRHNRVGEKKAEQEKIFEVNEDGMMITFKGEPLSLTPAEFDILNALIKHKNGVVSRADIIYQSDFISDDSSYKNVDVMVSKIRSKIARHDPDHAYIKSVRGVGYQLLCPPQKNS